MPIDLSEQDLANKKESIKVPKEMTCIAIKLDASVSKSKDQWGDGNSKLTADLR